MMGLVQQGHKLRPFRDRSSQNSCGKSTAHAMHYVPPQGGFQVHYCQPQPRFRAAAIAPGAEQPDVESPRWSNCTVPVVFWPYWWAAAVSRHHSAKQIAPSHLLM